MTEDYRYVDLKTGERVSYLETLKAMVAFGHRWHSKAEWHRIEKELSGMTEEQAEAKVRQINREVDCRLKAWEGGEG